MPTLMIDMGPDREVSIYYGDADKLYFDYYVSGEGDQRTKTILVSELYQILHDAEDFKKKIEREQINSEIKLWKDKCDKIDKQNQKLQDENSGLRSNLQVLKETINIVGKK